MTHQFPEFILEVPSRRSFQPWRKFIGSSADDSLKTNRRDFVSQYIHGRSGDDVLTSSGRSSDVMFGGHGDDRLIARSGIGNVLNGGSGNDVLSGGKHTDIFVMTEGFDVVTNFNVRNVRNSNRRDKIGIKVQDSNIQVETSEIESGLLLELIGGTKTKRLLLEGVTQEQFDDLPYNPFVTVEY